MYKSVTLIEETRIQAFRNALLNTCVRAAHDGFENLKLSNCLDSYEFCQLAYQWLQLPLFKNPVEPAMDVARHRLMIEMEIKEYSA